MDGVVVVLLMWVMWQRRGPDYEEHDKNDERLSTSVQVQVLPALCILWCLVRSVNSKH